MKLHNRAWYLAIGGILALVLVFGAVATFAQTDETEPDAAVPESPVEATGESSLPLPWGRHGRGVQGAAGQDIELLAEALGITVEELQAAQEAAHAAAIEQAVTDGLLTQEQADQDKGAFLAEALGITEEALQAAMADVRAARLTELVESGALTQEQVDLMIARQAVEQYIDREALSETIQNAYQSAVEQAVADGVITQAQADRLLQSQPAFGFNGGPQGFGGGHGSHRFGGFRGGPGGAFPGGMGVDPLPGADVPASTSLGSNA
jgi:ribosomal protein S20